MNNRHPVVYNPFCLHCKKSFYPETLVWSIGSPYHMIIHKECAPYFQYEDGYPHALPFQQYDKKSNQYLKSQ